MSNAGEVAEMVQIPAQVHSILQVVAEARMPRQQAFQLHLDKYLKLLWEEQRKHPLFIHLIRLCMQPVDQALTEDKAVRVAQLPILLVILSLPVDQEERHQTVKQ